MKKIALLFIIMLMPMFAEADGYRLTIDGVCYFLTEKGATVMPVKSNKYAGNVNIPATIVYQNKSYPVYRIYDEAFRECEDLLSVTIGGNSIKIGDYAFYRCSKLTSVVIPDTIEEIGMGAFTFCKNLTYVTPPKSLKKIEDSCFGSCSSLKYFHLPANIETIGKFVFSGCTSLKDIYCYATTVPNTADQAFDNYPQITLHVPAASVSAYQAVDPWKNFKEIVALPAQEGETENDDYHPFVKEGKTWNYQEYYHNLWNDEQWTKDVSYVINGTKEIDGKTYYKMNRIIENVSEYCCALREENRKVWMYYDGGDHLLYDFGMSVGDSYNPLLSWESYCYQLTAIKPVQFHDNHLFNVLYYDIFEDPIDHDSYIASAPIVEGVGCEKGWNIMVLNALIPSNGILQGENFLSCYEDGECIFTADDFKCLTNPNPADNMTYRPFVEEGKVWKVGVDSGNPVQVVDYYYFDGDTIINGKACKQMMCEQFVNPDYVDYDYVMRYPQLSYVGAWYEEDKKVYFYNANNKRFTLWYDFSADANDTIQILGQSYVIGSKQTGGMKGFKGVYRDVMMVWDEEQNNYNTTWLEGVGSIEGPGYNVYLGEEYHGGAFLMSCTVGDEVIYLNDEYEDGATPAEARKKRFDFTHTIKIQPKAPMKREKASGRSAEEQSLYGEYNDLQLDIHLNPLDEAYLVRIANESGQVVYEKTVNAGNIVALNIDISAYAKGRYIVTVENNHESFAGGFEAQTTGIEENVIIEKLKNVSIYNLHGQRISSLRKGLNIVNGQKIYVK